MKSFFLTIVFLFSSLLIFAQRNFKTQVNSGSLANARILSCEDTLGLCAYDTLTKAVYRDQLGGYAVGTNFFGDLAKAQEFQFDDSIRYNIRKVMFFFAAKKTAVTDSFLLIHIYKIDSLGFISGNSTRACPDTILATRKLYLDSIDTIPGHPTIVDFQWGVSTKGKFAVGFDMSHLDTADQIGLYSTMDSTAGKKELAWEKQSNGRWYSLLRSWPLDVNLAIFPIVDKTAIGIKEQQHNQSQQFQLAPNPANDNLLLQVKSEKSEQVQVFIYDYLNRLVYSSTKQLNGNGNHLINLSTEQFTPGIYSCIVRRASGMQSKKLVIQH